MSFSYMPAVTLPRLTETDKRNTPLLRSPLWNGHAAERIVAVLREVMVAGAC